MGGRNDLRFTVQEEILQPTTTETADGTGVLKPSTQTARVIEVWLNVTNVSGTTPSLELVLETSIDGVNFEEEKRISAVTTTGIFKMVLNRADQALGKKARVRWEITGTTPSFTFEVRMIRME